MSNLAVFNFNQNEVRTITDKNGDPWFVARDVCDVLELENITNAVKSLDDDELTLTKLKSGGQYREMTIISESGLYALIMRSNKPQAKPFRKWVTGEVLPSIRKTGQYSIRKPGEVLTTSQIARDFKAFKSIAMTAGLKGNPAVISADTVMRRVFGVSPLQLMQIELKSEDQKILFTPTELANQTGIKSAREVNKRLANAGLQENINGKWYPTEKAEGYYTLIDTGKRHNSGAMVQQLKWKPTVITYLSEGASA